jgi:hypothetical protein
MSQKYFSNFKFMTNIFGVTSTYAMLAGHMVSVFSVSTAYFASQMTPMNYWLFPLHVGSGKFFPARFSFQALGSAVAEAESKQKVVKSKTELTGGQLAAAFAGGFAMTVGSAIANGSPSVHGLSGLCQLSTGSLIATVSMFGGGILASKIMD